MKWLKYCLPLRTNHYYVFLIHGWLVVWALQSFVFQSTSGRLPEIGKKKREKTDERKKVLLQFTKACEILNITHMLFQIHWKTNEINLRKKRLMTLVPILTSSAVGPCPTIIQISRTPRHWKNTQHHRSGRPLPFFIQCRFTQACEILNITHVLFQIHWKNNEINLRKKETNDPCPYFNFIIPESCKIMISKVNARLKVLKARQDGEWMDVCNGIPWRLRRTRTRTHSVSIQVLNPLRIWSS